MFAQTVQALRDFEDVKGVTLRERGAALIMTTEREGIQIEMTVPFEVLEWFVVVTTRNSDCRAEDWCDYTGYDSTAIEDLAEDMVKDLREFITALHSRSLRVTSTRSWSRTRHVLEWLTPTGWKPAVPFGSTEFSE